MTKSIPLTQGQSTLVDAADYEYLSQWRWYYHNGYAARWEGTGGKNRKIIYMHRVILQTPPEMLTDHANGDGLDNRRENLRVCTYAENICNRGVKRNNKTGLKGVSLHKLSGLYRARIKVNKVDIWLGYFKTPEEAAAAYDSAVVKYHGKFAKGNSI